MADIKNTKNLCTVATDVVSDSTNFIVEDNRELKRIPKDQIIINSLTQLVANDTSNLLTGGEVSAQEILDVIADKVANKLLAKNQIVNNLLATEVGNVLDATQGKFLMDKINQLNSDLPIIGKFTNKKHKDIIKIGSVVNSRSVVCVLPRYNTLTTIRCIYSSLEINAGEDQFQLFAWDTDTQNESISTSLEGYYIIMPILSK